MRNGLQTIMGLWVSRRFYFIPVVAFLFMMGFILFLFPAGRSFFILNGVHSPVTDFFFTYFTHAGDGLFAIGVGVCLLVFYHYAAGFAFLLGFAFTGLTNYALKTFIFFNSPRPVLFFWKNPAIHLVEGVSPHVEYSFPSGHANTAFFIFTFLALLRWKHYRWMQLFFAAGAILVAWSRVYLGHHFVGDITAGACIGILAAFLFYPLSQRWAKHFTLSKNLRLNIIKK